MNTLYFTTDTVRLMGVHVLAVYMLLRCAEQEGIAPVQAKWILDHMPDKTSPNTVTAALRWLTSPERQIAVRTMGGWRLNKENAFQLPLTYNLPEGDNLVNQNHSESDSRNKNRALRDSLTSVVVVDDLFSEVPTITTTTTTRDENRALRDSLTLAALNRALDEYQIIGKKRKDLFACEWVTGDYIRAHVEYAKGEPANWDNPVGMAINRMLERLDAPENTNPGKIYKTSTVDRGKRGIETLSYTFDVDQEAADFTEHRKGCSCMDCSVYRTNGPSALCAICKHYLCECKEDSE